MNTTDLIESLSRETGISKRDCKEIVTQLFEKIIVEVRRGNDVRIAKFGTFRCEKRDAYTGKNPQTGKDIRVPPRKHVRFRPGLRFRELIK